MRRVGGRGDDDPVPRSVLVVDDHAEYRISVRALLEADGFVVLGEAGTGAEAIRAVGRLSPDVVLLDIRLPDMDGTAAAARIKGDPRTAHIPIVALTSLAMKGDRETLLGAGFDGYLEKPISVREFPDQVRGFLVGC